MSSVKLLKKNKQDQQVAKMFGETESLQDDIWYFWNRFGSDKIYYLIDFLLGNLLLVLIFGCCILSEVLKESSWVFVLGS